MKDYGPSGSSLPVPRGAHAVLQREMERGAERSDAIASEIAIHTEKNTEEIKRLLRQNTELIEAIEALTREVHMRIVGDGKGERPHTPGPL